jgi:hypothetical protein
MNMKKFIKVIALLSLVTMLLVPAASAAAPYATYTYSSSGFALESPDAYVPDTIVDSEYMGESISDPRDLTVDDDGNVYLVDGSGAKVVVLDKYYKVKFTITDFVNDQGVPDTFTNPSGVFASDSHIYVCDTDNNRIVMFDKTGEFEKVVPQPESDLFDSDSIYKPIAVAVDTYGRLFVVSSTTYEGVIVMGDNGDFYGFIGAQKVSTGSTFSKIWEMFRSEEQKKYDEENISGEYNNITIDKDNFVYVTTSTIDEDAQQSAITSKSTSSDYAPVKKLNASGSDVMRRNGFYPPSGEVDVSTSDTDDIVGASTIVDVAVGPEGTWSIIDEKRSKVFTYDNDGNLLFAFGDKGAQVGNIDSLTAITYHDDKILLLDKTNLSFTVYRRTEYGDILINAIADQNNLENINAAEGWAEILKRNNNFDLAYIGIGKSLYRNGNYAEALDYFVSAKDLSDYSSSFQKLRKDWANKYFILMIVIVVAVIVAVYFGFRYAGKVNKETAVKVGPKSIKEELLYSLYLIFHPFDGYWDLKHEKRGSPRSAFIILLIVVLSVFYNSIGSGTLMSGGTVGSYDDIYGAVIAVIVPLALFIVANWCLTTLFEGEGNMSDIFVASCYSLTPLPMFLIPTTILSNVLISSETGIITMLNTIAFIWVFMLLFFGMMITHDYSLGKNVLVILGTILGMAFIMFVCILFSALVSKIVSFVSSIFIELEYRL